MQRPLSAALPELALLAGGGSIGAFGLDVCEEPVGPEPEPVPTAPKASALLLTGNCYDRSAEAFGQTGGAALDELTYTVLDQSGNTYNGPVSITEHNTIIQGTPLHINTTWNLTAGQPMQDQISSGAGQDVFQETESYFLSGSSTPLTINWFFGDKYSVLGIYATHSSVIINSTVPVNRGGTSHYCDQPPGRQLDDLDKYHIFAGCLIAGFISSGCRPCPPSPARFLSESVKADLDRADVVLSGKVQAVKPAPTRPCGCSCD